MPPLLMSLYLSASRGVKSSFRGFQARMIYSPLIGRNTRKQMKMRKIISAGLVDVDVNGI